MVDYSIFVSQGVCYILIDQWKMCVFQADIDLNIDDIEFENPDEILNDLRVVLVTVKELHAA